MSASKTRVIGPYFQTRRKKKESNSRRIFRLCRTLGYLLLQGWCVSKIFLKSLQSFINRDWHFMTGWNYLIFLKRGRVSWLTKLNVFRETLDKMIVGKRSPLRESWSKKVLECWNGERREYICRYTVNLCQFLDKEEALFVVHLWSVVINDHSLLMLPDI